MPHTPRRSIPLVRRRKSTSHIPLNEVSREVPVAGQVSTIFVDNQKLPNEAPQLVPQTLDPNLVRIVTAWPTLSQNMKAAILALIKPII